MNETKGPKTSQCPRFDALVGRADLRQRVLRETAPADLALALIDAGEEVKSFLLEPLTGSELETLEKERPLYPRRIDVGAAQRNILRQLGLWEEEEPI